MRIARLLAIVVVIGALSSALSRPQAGALAKMVADRQALPSMTWTFADTPEGARVEAKVSAAPRQFTLWTADSADRDFRDEKWSSQPVEPANGGRDAVAKVPRPAAGFRAFLVEATLDSPTGQAYRLSTEARVTPDSIR